MLQYSYQAFPVRAQEVPGLIDRIAMLVDDPDTATVEEICVALDISHARLTRACRRAYGHTPKYLLRRARFMRMLTELRIRHYAEWRSFLDPRYFDQSHFIRDCRYFLGMAPTRYLELPEAMRASLANSLVQPPATAGEAVH